MYMYWSVSDTHLCTVDPPTEATSQIQNIHCIQKFLDEHEPLEMRTNNAPVIKTKCH